MTQSLKPNVWRAIKPRRRVFLKASAVGLLSLRADAGQAAAWTDAARATDDATFAIPGGTLQIIALSERALRVRVIPTASLEGTVSRSPDSLVLQRGDGPSPRLRKSMRNGATRWSLPHLHCDVDEATGNLRFYDGAGRLLLAEVPGTRKLTQGQLGDEQIWIAEQGFESPAGERLYGTGCFQDGALDLRGLPRRLTQVNTQISLPFLLSSQGYGLLWHQAGMSELNPPDRRLVLRKMAAIGAAQLVDVTTATGNAQVARKDTVFEGHFSIERSGRCAFLLDIGRPMASRHYVEIDGRTCLDIVNQWLPPTAGFMVELQAGPHHVRVLASDDDAPVLHYGQAQERTLWRSPVAEALDYVVIAGPKAADVMAGYREIAGAAPMMPLWAYGYIHCRERFHTADEIIETTNEFRRRRLPVDVMVQDWQYWGRHGWNAMRFDEANYPDPAGMIRTLHGLNVRFMLSVWAKIDRNTDLGKSFAARDYYIPGTDWVDFFAPKAAAAYVHSQNERLGALGVDAWWQDATEPENDDLVGRRTAAGAGERVRLAYPWYVTHTVYQGQRAALPEQRVMILTRSAFPGQHRHAAATWSGDIGNDWDTLKRQIPAGLNMAAAGYAYWTVDAGGFFRPGEGQYTDPAYHERLVRWLQLATFLPLMRVHGYMTRTEFWHYGAEVEAHARRLLELRYRLLPYIYGLAADVTRRGLPIMRPLVFDFSHDPKALDQVHSYMFGTALHVAPVYAPDVQTWPVYLPRTPGGWVDFWTGERRQGGRTHQVPSPLSRLPLHLRAGSILPLGPVLQSTAEASGDVLDLYIAPGCDGTYELYEDGGLDYSYEAGACSVVRMTWDDRRSVLRLAARVGSYAAMPRVRRFRVHRMEAGYGPMPVAEGRSLTVNYDGRAVATRIPPQPKR